MLDFLTLGPAPYEEDCVQVSKTREYVPGMIAEARRFMSALQRRYPDADLRVRRFPHDFGSYYEVVVMYDPEDADSAALAAEIENDLPGTWEEIEI